MGRWGLAGEGAAQVRQPPSQWNVRWAAPPHPAAVVGDLKGTTLVIVQTTAWTESIFINQVLIADKADNSRTKILKLMNNFGLQKKTCISKSVPSHLSPCRTSPHSISPQWSQKAGARYECTNRQCGRIWKSSTVAEAAQNEKISGNEWIQSVNQSVEQFFFFFML